MSTPERGAFPLAWMRSTSSRCRCALHGMITRDSLQPWPFSGSPTHGKTQPGCPKSQKLGNRHIYSAFTLTATTAEQEQTCTTDTTEQGVCTAVAAGLPIPEYPGPLFQHIFWLNLT